MSFPKTESQAIQQAKADFKRQLNYKIEQEKKEMLEETLANDVPKLTTTDQLLLYLSRNNLKNVKLTYYISGSSTRLTLSKKLGEHIKKALLNNVLIVKASDGSVWQIEDATNIGQGRYSGYDEYALKISKPNMKYAKDI